MMARTTTGVRGWRCTQLRNRLAGIRRMHQDIKEVYVAAIGNQQWLLKNCSGFRVARQGGKIAQQDSLDSFI